MRRCRCCVPRRLPRPGSGQRECHQPAAQRAQFFPSGGTHPGLHSDSGASGQFGDIPVNTTWDSNFSINGGQGYSNEIMIDGAPSTTGFFNQITTMPSVDALVEFKVQSNSMSAEFGRTGGGVLNVTTKSGTNALHGTLFEFLRNSVIGGE